MPTLLTTRFAPPALAAASQAMLSDGAPHELMQLSSTQAEISEISAVQAAAIISTYEYARASRHVRRVPWGPSVAVGIPVALNVFEISREGPAAWPVGRPLVLRVEDMEEVD